MGRLIDRLLWIVGLAAVLLGLPGCVFHPNRVALPTAVADLPLIVLPANNSGPADPDARHTLVIMLSGDGGWVGLDKSVGRSLSKAGFAVVGWDSLRYYWHSHEPSAAASDLARIIATFSQSYQRSRVALVGYSRGADVLPFLYNRLDPDTQARVSSIVLLGLTSRITFGYHLLAWIGLGPEGRAVMPEARQLPADRTSCLYGADDPDAICRELQAAGFDVQALAGGHHFARNYPRLARLIRQRIDAAS